MVDVSAESINKLGNQFDNWADNTLPPAITTINSISIEPGNFADGDNLKSTVKSRQQELTTCLTNIKKATASIGSDLHLISTKYHHTENSNATTASDLDQMVKDVSSALPGLNNTPNSNS
jgi:hypothetical protein